MKVSYKEIYDAYKKTGLHNRLLEGLGSNLSAEREYAMKHVDACAFQSADDVKLYVALNV